MKSFAAALLGAFVATAASQECINLKDTKTCSGLDIKIPAVTGLSMDVNAVEMYLNNSASPICNGNLKWTDIAGMKEYQCYNLAKQAAGQAPQSTCASKASDYTLCHDQCIKWGQNYADAVAKCPGQPNVGPLQLNFTEQCSWYPVNNCNSKSFTDTSSSTQDSAASSNLVGAFVGLVGSALLAVIV